jgi:hypothetical protein
VTPAQSFPMLKKGNMKEQADQIINGLIHSQKGNANFSANIDMSS